MSKNGWRLFKNYDPVITSPFGARDAVYDSAGNLISPAGVHYAVDYGTNAQKLPQYALEEGIVKDCGIYASDNNAKYAYIEYPRLGYIGMHYHLDSISVAKGQTVNANTIIGYTGMTFCYTNRIQMIMHTYIT